MKSLVSSVIAVVIFTAVLGFGYPALMTGFGQVAFADKANGSLVEQNGKVVGSELAAQGFTKPQYFHERPSATSPAYNAAGTTFDNLGPTNPDLQKQIDGYARAILKLERPYNPGLTKGEIPVDAVTTSGSGSTRTSRPHTPSSRRAALPLCATSRSRRSQQLIDDATDGRSLGFLGEPGVNVLKLNLALDERQTT